MPPLSRPARQHGVSLVEIMIAAAIVGVVAALVIPSFQESSALGKRSDGQIALVKASQLLKTFYTENNTFTTNLASAGLNAATPEGFYLLSVVAPTGACPITRCFLLQATPQGEHAGDRCGLLTYTSTGASGAADANCW